MKRFGICASFFCAFSVVLILSCITRAYDWRLAQAENAVAWAVASVCRLAFAITFLEDQLIKSLGGSQNKHQELGLWGFDPCFSSTCHSFQSARAAPIEQFDLALRFGPNELLQVLSLTTVICWDGVRRQQFRWLAPGSAVEARTTPSMKHADFHQQVTSPRKAKRVGCWFFSQRISGPGQPAIWRQVSVRSWPIFTTHLFGTHFFRTNSFFLNQLFLELHFSHFWGLRFGWPCPSCCRFSSARSDLVELSARAPTGLLCVFPAVSKLDCWWMKPNWQHLKKHEWTYF